MSVRVMAHRDGETTDVTEGVQALYDLLINSLDWGSGFISVEDARPLVELAHACGFRGSEEAEEYLADQVHAEEENEYLHEHPEANELGTRRVIPNAYVINGRSFDNVVYDLPHEHAWSSVGRCMWRFCHEKRPAATQG